MRATEAIKFKSQADGGEAAEATFNLPNILTFSRILMVPVFIMLFSNPTVERSIAAACVFGLAALTDLLDGYFARRRAQVTTMGRLLDPIADKILVISGLILLVQFQRVAAWIAIAMIVREIGVTGIRAIAAADGIIVAAGTLGKYKVVLQVVAILLLTLQEAIFLPFVDFSLWGTAILYLALLLSILSAGQYLSEVWRKFLDKGIAEKPRL